MALPLDDCLDGCVVVALTGEVKGAKSGLVTAFEAGGLSTSGLVEGSTHAPASLFNAGI